MRVAGLCLLLLAAVRPAAAASAVTIDAGWVQPLDVSDAPRTPVALPDSWNRIGRSGRWIYRFRFQGVPAGDPPWGLLLPRAGNRFSVTLNGWQVAQVGAFDGMRADHAQQPHLLFLPPQALREDHNELLMVVDGERARFAGVSRLTVGPIAELNAPFQTRQALQVWGSFAIILISFVFSAVSGLVAAAARNGTVGLFSLACALSALRTSFAVVTQTPFDYMVWDLLLDAAYVGYVICIAQFAVRVLGIKHARLRRLSIALGIVAAVAVPVFAFGRVVQARQVWTMCAIAYVLYFFSIVVRHWMAERTRNGTIIVVASVIAIGLGVRDHLLVFFVSDGYGAFSLARYSLLVFQLSMGGILIDWYGRAQRAAAELRAGVAMELALQRAELDRQLDVHKALAGERAKHDERQRILSDIHDGLGLQLQGLLSRVERSPSPDRQALSREVRTAIEQMRMLVESSEVFDGDVSMLFGHIRHTIERRLRTAGIDVNWQTELRAPHRRVVPAQGIELQRLMFELTTNTIKHAGARSVTVRIRDGCDDGRALSLEYRDDGCGFDPGAVSVGHGLRSIGRRVEELAGRMKLETVEGTGFCCRFAFPPSLFARDTAT